MANITCDYRCRREALLSVDDGVAAILRALKREGELRKKLVIFTSDNGFFQGEHRVKQGKIRLYEPSARVPVMMRGPRVPAGRRVSDLTANIDLAPTIVDAARAKPGRVFDGRSLLPLARRPWAFKNRDILIENGPSDGKAPQYDAIRTPRYLYAEYVKTGERELYDLWRDPHELRSRHASRRYAGVRRKLARRLAALRNCAGRGCRR